MFDFLYLNDAARETLLAIVEAQKAREHNETYLVGRLPDYRGLPPQTVLGSASYSSRLTRQTWLLETKAVDGGWGFTSPFHLAMAYLHHKYPHRKAGRLKSAQYADVVAVRRSAPLFAKPVRWIEGAYLDLKSAYWSIIQTVGWDVDYYPSKWLMKKSSNVDFPYPQHKLARNSLVSIGLPTQLVVWTGDKIEMVKRPNQWINVMLWSLVQDVLHGVAHDMVERAGAYYVHTDGYIVGLDDLPKAMQVFADWGLPMSIKAQGEMRVSGVGAYAVGESIGRAKVVGEKPFSNLRPHHKDWLRKRIAYFAERSLVDPTDAS